MVDNVNSERQYQFRERLNQVHRPDRRDSAVTAGTGRTMVGAGWRIVVGRDASAVTMQAANDFQDYLQTSMHVPVSVERVPSVLGLAEADQVIVLGTHADLPDFGAALSAPRSFRLQVDPGRIVVCGADERGVAQGCFHLEELMNLAEAPVVDCGVQTRAPLFSPRMVHSGWGMDQFPDAYLNVVAHAGMDAILVFAKGVDQTTVGYLDFNDLIRRAAVFGLDVYFYSYLKSLKHPDERDAAEHYESTYGALFKACPGARGIILVGESCEFPSKDPRTCGRRYSDPSPDGLPADKPHPGWWPCADFPEWLALVKTAVRRHNPSADIVFWTYNWGYAPEEDRLKLIRSLPDDITLQATFEMFEPIRREGVTHVATDYTISFEGPGTYFASEAAEAARSGLHLYTMSNTGGLTWDVGVIPYVPVPQQWARRHAALRQAQTKWGLSGLMESHHYGFSPSVVSELAKWAYWDPVRPTDEVLGLLARRDFGPDGAPFALRAWEAWSEAFRDYPTTNEDQYGPFRVGPSYPLVMHPSLSRTFAAKDIPMPSAEHAHFGGRIVFTFYKPYDLPQQTAGLRRLEAEQRLLVRMKNRWEEGLSDLERAVAAAPVRKRPEAERMLGLGRFIRNTLTTVLNVKQWYVLNLALTTAREPGEMHRILDDLIRVGEAEIANAEDTIPLVEADSRLGWEPSMEYMTDRAHLEWKIRQVRQVLTTEIPAYRQALDA